MKDFFRILKYVKPYLGYAGINIFFNILNIVFSLVSITMIIPFLGLLFSTQEKVYDPAPLGFSASAIKENFYALITNIIDDKGKVEALVFVCVLILVMFFFRNLCRYLALYFLSPIRNGVVCDLRNDLNKKILSLPISFFTEKRKGDITARMTTDLVEIEWSVMSSLEMFFKDPLNIIIFLIALIIISPGLTLFVIVLFPITGFLIALIGKSLKKSSAKGQNKMGELLSIIDENLSGLRIIKAFDAEKIIQQKFEKESADYKNIMTRLLRKKDLSSPMSEFLSTVVMIVVMWFGGKLVLSGNSPLSPEEFIGYIAIFSQLIPPAKSFTSAYYFIQKGSASAARIHEILDTENEIKDAKNAKTISAFKSEIKFEGVTFSYENIQVLKDINLSLKKGDTVALVGQSGSGKSTLADLISRFYDVKIGEVKIDGENIKNLKIADVRKLMGIVNQESILFNDSIFNNILLGNATATKEEVESAAKVANAHDFILQSENGYDTNIGDSGVKLSGGQKQRLSIARAILKNPPILILDEATSSLDTESEKLVQDALNNLMQSRTSIVIAHQLSTIQHADKIIVLHEGKIVEAGTHNELLANNKHYKKLYDLQDFS
ncbi:MAG TPA: ABC transporter ATP-binding protein [Flavobacteriales bacterium]|jgi:subfamily B ATP-binding cassette protein MsbA|nr:ABC transporter ATP-binding protein [Flavobacteriales bacterium]HIL66446.1 ABC transporter ATP-binding protein [Flavobacteriales bacterium]